MLRLRFILLTLLTLVLVLWSSFLKRGLALLLCGLLLGNSSICFSLSGSDAASAKTSRLRLESAEVVPTDAEHIAVPPIVDHRSGITKLSCR